MAKYGKRVLNIQARCVELPHKVRSGNAEQIDSRGILFHFVEPPLSVGRSTHLQESLFQIARLNHHPDTGWI